MPILNRFTRVFWNYLIISVIVTAIDVGLLYILTEYANLNYLVSATFSYCVGLILAYIGQKIFTFKDQNKKIAKQFSLFTIVSIIGLLINLLILKVFVEYFGIHYMISKVIAIGAGFIWNYSINKKFTFKK